MTKKELIEALLQSDTPMNEDVFMMDGEYGPTEILMVEKAMHYAITENGNQLPKMVLVLQ